MSSCERIAEILLSFVEKQNLSIKSGTPIEFIPSSLNYGMFMSLPKGHLLYLLKYLISDMKAVNPLGKIEISLKNNLDEDGGIVSVAQDPLTKHPPGNNPQITSGISVTSIESLTKNWNIKFGIDYEHHRIKEIEIEIPLVVRPDYHLPILSINPSTNVVVCDDDDQHFTEINEALADCDFPGENLHRVLNPTEFRDLLKSRNPDFCGNIFLIISDEFKSSNESGLDVIKELSLEGKSVLITPLPGFEKTTGPRDYTGIKVLPGLLISITPFEVIDLPKVEVIFIDDVWNQHYGWKLSARKHNKTFKSYLSPFDFIKEKSFFAPQTPIHIDSELGLGVKGEIVAKDIFDLGFKEIWMATGHKPSKFKDMYWLKGVRGKYPPWVNRKDCEY